jgi:DnaA family protein
MNPQLPLALELPNPTRLSDFIAGPNAQILELLAQQRTGDGERLLYLSGEPGSGRTHLLLGQCNATQQQGDTSLYLPARELLELTPGLLDGLERYALIAFDDVDYLAGRPDWEQALFHLFNRAADRGARLLFSARVSAAQAGFRLPDLSTRLAWGITYRLRPLADAHRQALLITLAARRGLDMPPEVARYILERHSRAIGALQDLVKRLDRASLKEQRRLTIPFVREQLAG